MPQTEVLIHIVLDGEHALDPEAQAKINVAAINALTEALGDGVLASRTSIEVRPVPQGEPQAADAPQPPAPAPAEAAPGLDVGGGEQTAAPVGAAPPAPGGPTA